MLVKKQRGKHKHPRHFLEPGHRLRCLLSCLYEILSSVEYVFVLLPTGDVSSYRFPSRSGFFFCFLSSFQGPSQGSFQFPLYGDSSALGWLLSDNFHTSKPVLPLSCSLTVLPAAVHLAALLILPFLGSGTSSS